MLSKFFFVSLCMHPDKENLNAYVASGEVVYDP